MTANLIAYAVLILLSLAVAVGVYRVLQKSFRGVLDEVIKLPAATTFFLRILLITLVFIAVSEAGEMSLKAEEGSAFMEYVWWIASGLSDVLKSVWPLLLAYLALAALFLLFLRREHA